MRESRLSGSVEGVMSDHDSYSDCMPIPVEVVGIIVASSCQYLRKKFIHSIGTTSLGRLANPCVPFCPRWSWVVNSPARIAALFTGSEKGNSRLELRTFFVPVQPRCHAFLFKKEFKAPNCFGGG